MIQWGDFLIDPREGEDLCRMAVLLAMTVDQKMERDLILQLQKMGIKSAATTVAGFGISSQSNIIRSVVNLCLNTNIIERKREHVHPVAHCVLEVTQSTRASDAIGQNFWFKAAVARKGNHFALSFYGNLAMHEVSQYSIKKLILAEKYQHDDIVCVFSAFFLPEGGVCQKAVHILFS